MATPLIGTIILLLTVCSIIGGMLYKHIMWERAKPKEEYRGVRFQLEPGCIEWPDMKVAIDTMFEKFDKSRVDDIMADLCIRVNPYDRPLVTPEYPTGYIGKNGFSAPPPTNADEALNVMILNGHTEFVKKWPIGRSTAFVYVRQHRPGDTKVEGRLLTGTTPVVPNAAKSALFHEVAEHVNPFRMGEGTNNNHARTDLQALTKELTLACLEKEKGVTP